MERDWALIANQLRRKSLAKMINLGEHEPAAYNFDGAHRATLEDSFKSIISRILVRRTGIELPTRPGMNLSAGRIFPKHSLCYASKEFARPSPS